MSEGPNCCAMLCKGIRLFCFGVGVELDVEVEAVRCRRGAGGPRVRRWLARMDAMRAASCAACGAETVKVCVCCGRGWRRKVASVMTARVPKAAGDEFAEVVAGDVFDDLAAGAGDGAVGEDEGHADDEVAEAAVAVAERAGVVGGEDAADGGAVGPEGIEGHELAVPGEGVLELLPGAAGLHRAGEVLPGMLENAVEAGEVKAEICGDGIGPGLLGVAACGGDGEPFSLA